jgi:hypothetical protein
LEVIAMSCQKDLLREIAEAHDSGAPDRVSEKGRIAEDLGISIRARWP